VAPKVTGTMNVEIPENASEEELEQIQNVLAQSIADSLGCNPEQIKVTIDPTTGVSMYTIWVEDDLEKTEDLMSTSDFATNLNSKIAENSENLPAQIREVLAVKDVNVNSLFQNNHNKTKQFQNSNFSLSKFVSFF
jgi:phenylpyruvate tautomerase PptA (4-oxalocrotonate tautomerase family)